ncbi:MAG: hypothetical protein UY03_C0010G0009 [Parcubacteria group bacterium GW2011_GWA2_47_64]|nr:MAG: hypothetical protein UY03_C0010G0009 [Parcubacteria group bacterium GW2011_GWA2_47_64]KKU97139.1 MAG: hypothetical protein UY29_C0002G0036 [Parcubacteria group bacterium GW2011_GWC2_48_17]
MDAFGVVKGQIIHELPVEGFGIKEKVGMVIHEFLLHPAVEPFHVGVQLRRLGVGMVMDEVETTEFLREMLLELTPVVGQHEVNGVRENLQAEDKELLCRQRGVGGGCPGEGEAGVDVLKGDDVTPDAENEPFNGIERHEVAGVCRLEVLWLAQYLLPVCFHDSPGTRDFLRVDAQTTAVCYEPTDGTGLGTVEMECGRERQHERMQFLRSEIWMDASQTAEFLDDANIPETFPLLLGSFVPAIEAFELPLPLFELPLPQVQSTLFHLERLFDRFRAVFVPKGEYSDPPLRLLGNHMPEA